MPSGTTLIIEPGTAHLIGSIPIFAINADKVNGAVYRQAVPSMFGGMDVYLSHRRFDVWTRGVDPNRPVLVMLGTSTEEVTFINDNGIEEQTVINMPDFIELEMEW